MVNRNYDFDPVEKKRNYFKNNNRKKSIKKEKKLAELVGGNTTPNSGATDAYKGDVRSPHFLWEQKTTKKKYIYVKIKDLLKIKNQAENIFKNWCYQLELSSSGRDNNLYKWIITEEIIFNKYCNLNIEKEFSMFNESYHKNNFGIKLSSKILGKVFLFDYPVISITIDDIKCVLCELNFFLEQMEDKNE